MRIPILVLVCITSLVTGCSHLYNKERDDTATAAKADYDASKLSERIAGQRALLNTLEEQDVAAFRKLTLVERDKTLLALVASTLLPAYDPMSPAGATTAADAATKSPIQATVANGFVWRFLEKTEKRMKDIDGDLSASKLRHSAMTSAENLLALAREEQIIARQDAESFGVVDLPGCDNALAALAKATNIAALAPLVKPAVLEKARRNWSEAVDPINTLGKSCALQQSAEKDRAAVVFEKGRLLAGAAIAYITQETNVHQREADAMEAKRSMKAAVDALGTATKELDKNNKLRDFTCKAPTTDGSAPKVDKATDDLCKAIDKLKGLGGLGKKILAEEKIARIGTVLQAMSGITPDQEADNYSALALIAATTRLSHALRQYQGAETWPALEPLIIEKQLADADLAAANALVALEKARLGYRFAIVSGLREELHMLRQARALVTGYYGDPTAQLATACPGKDAGKSIQLKRWCASYEGLQRDNEFNHNGVTPERPAFMAMVKVANSFSTSRDQQRTAQVRLALSGYKESLIHSEQALAAWRAVLETPIDLLRKYHAGKIKPNEWAPLLQTIGLFGIANGVN